MARSRERGRCHKSWVIGCAVWGLATIVATGRGAEETPWRPATRKIEDRAVSTLPLVTPGPAEPSTSPIPPSAVLPPPPGGEPKAGSQPAPGLPLEAGSLPPCDSASSTGVPLSSGSASPGAAPPVSSSDDEPLWRPATPCQLPLPGTRDKHPTPTTLPDRPAPAGPGEGLPVRSVPSEPKPPAAGSPSGVEGVQGAPLAGPSSGPSRSSPGVPPIPPRIPPADSPPEGGKGDNVPSHVLPVPRLYPSVSPVTAEWPVAPPELLIPEHQPDATRTFGSPSLRLSRDYPSLAELCDGWLAPPFGPGWRHGRSDGIDWPLAYVQTEYLLWWMSPLNIPILATTNPDPNRFGYLNEPGTVPIVGPGRLIDPFRNGLRVRAGLWDAARRCALDGSFFFLSRETASIVVDSHQFPIITRPVFSPNPRPGSGGIIGETGEAVAVPNILRGQFRVDASSLLWGMDANLRCCLRTTEVGQLTGLIGYRYLNLSEALEMKENIVVIGPGNGRLNVPDPPGTVVFVRDRFATENRFHGGQVGFTWERRWGAWTFWGRATIAFGITEQELEIYGIQTRIRPNQPPVFFPGGLLAAASNLGTFQLDRFSVVPEVTVQVGYRLSPAWQLYLGYNFLYWTNVLRPGEQIDRVVDLTQVPNAPSVPFSGQFRPRPLFRQSDLLVTGLQFGLEWRW